MTRWWCSFCDPRKPRGEQFLGLCIVEAVDQISAVRVTHALGINPGGEVAFMDAYVAHFRRAGLMRLPRVHRRYQTEPRDSRWAIRALEYYLAIWQEARARIVERCMVGMLLAGSDDETRKASLELGYDCIDRTAIASLQWSGPAEPFSLATFREAALRILNKPEPPPVQPWISRQRAAQLVSEGIPRALIEKHFAIG